MAAAPARQPAAPAAAKLVTRNVHWHRTSIGGLLVFGEVVNRGTADARGFRVRGVKIEPENPGFSQRVSGVVANAGGKTAKVAAVTVALYKGARLVWVADQGFLYPYSTSQVVPPRKTAPFRASVTGYTKKPGRMVTYVRASTKGANGFYLP